MALLHAPLVLAATEPVLFNPREWWALGMGVLLFAAALYFCYFALFIHLATRIVGLHRKFRVALGALLLNAILQLFATYLIALFAPYNNLAYVFAYWIAATLSVMVAYEAGVVRSVISAVLTVALTIFGTLISMVIFLALFGHFFRGIDG